MKSRKQHRANRILYTFRWEPNTLSVLLHVSTHEVTVESRSPPNARKASEGQGQKLPDHWRETNPRGVVATIHTSTQIIQRISWTQETQKSTTDSFEDLHRLAFVVLQASLKAEFGFLFSQVLFFFCKFSNFQLNFK